MDIQSVKLNAGGEVTDVMIGGNTYSMEQAVKLAKSGEIRGVKIAQRENGEEYIAAFDNGMKLADMPEFE